MRVWGPCLVVLATLACGGGGGPTYRAVTAPNGQPAAWITCKQNQGDCYEKAGEICPNGYGILREDGSVVSESTRGNAWGGPNSAAIQVEKTRNYEGHLFVQCRSAAAPPAIATPAPVRPPPVAPAPTPTPTAAPPKPQPSTPPAPTGTGQVVKETPF